MNTIEITIFSALLLIIFINTILDHLFNWWFRNWQDVSGLEIIPAFVYIVKTIALVYILYEIFVPKL